MADTTELDELESGLTSGFWDRFKAHVDAEWGLTGTTYQDAVKRAVMGAVGTEAESVARLKVVMAQQDAIQRLLTWPKERAAALRRGLETPPAHPGRRGGL